MGQQGLGLAGAYGAGAAADQLQRIIAQRLKEGQDRERALEDSRRYEDSLTRQVAQDAESQRRFDSTMEFNREQARRREEQDERRYRHDENVRGLALMDKDAERQRTESALSELVQTSPWLKTAIDAKRAGLGVGFSDPHQLEDPTVHRGHVADAGKDRIGQIVAEENARAGARASVADRVTRRDVVNAMRAARQDAAEQYRALSAASPTGRVDVSLDDLTAQLEDEYLNALQHAEADAGGGLRMRDGIRLRIRPLAPSGTPDGGGRGAGPGTPPVIRPTQIRPVEPIEQRARVVLEAEAKRRGLTAPITDDVVKQFLANPQNRARLEQR